MGVIAYQRRGVAAFPTGHSALKGKPMKEVVIGLSALILATTLAGPMQASAQTPLGKNSYVTERLVAARVADRIRKTCPTIGARLIRAMSELQALQSYALKAGYSKAEMKAYLKDPVEKQKIYAKAEAYLAAGGATAGNVDGFCALGHKEIVAQSIAGSLIYKK